MYCAGSGIGGIIGKDITDTDGKRLLFMDKLSCQKSTRSGFLLIINF
jgi:hypothetical protein